MASIDQIVRSVAEDEPHDGMDARVSHVVQYDYAASLQQLVNVEEVDESVIERMPSVNEPELRPPATFREFRENLL